MNISNLSRIMTGVIVVLWPRYFHLCMFEPQNRIFESRQLVKLCQEKQLSAGLFEKKQLETLKKIKQRMRLQNTWGYLLLIILFIMLGARSFLFHQDGYISFYSLYLMELLSMGILLMHSFYARQSGLNDSKIKQAKYQWLAIIFSVLLDIGLILLLSYLVHQKGIIPGLAPEQVGPFLKGIQALTFTLQLLLLLAVVYEILRKEMSQEGLLYTSVTGIFLAYGYHQWQIRLWDDIAAARIEAYKITAIIIAIGMAAVGIWKINERNSSAPSV